MALSTAKLLHTCLGDNPQILTIKIASHLKNDAILDRIKGFGFNVINYEYSQTDVQTYLNSFEKLIKDEPNGIVLVPAFNNKTKNILKRLEIAKIPYFFLNINLKGFNNLSFIGQDSEFIEKIFKLSS